MEVKIPPKREIVVSAPLGFLQNKFYRATVDKSILHLVRNKEVRVSVKSFASLVNTALVLFLTFSLKWELCRNGCVAGFGRACFSELRTMLCKKAMFSITMSLRVLLIRISSVGCLRKIILEKKGGPGAKEKVNLAMNA